MTLTATPNGGLAPYTYAWTNPNNVAAGNTNSVSANITGIWSVLITDACGTSTIGTSNVQINPIPTASITQSTPICVGGNLTLTAVTNAVGSPTYAWTGPAPIGGSAAAAPSATNITTANAGVYTLVVSNNGCSSAPANTTVTVNPNPTVAPSAAPPTVCAGANALLNANASLPTSTYCLPGYSTGCTFPDVISNVSFAGINRSSGCDALNGLGYSNIASPQGSVVAGTTYPISVTTDGDLENLKVWIDWNRNGTFEPSEVVLQRTGTPTAPPQTTSGNVLVPLTAFNGPTRMRVHDNYSTAFVDLDPCSSVTWGETEDYVINVSGGVSQLSYAWTGGTFLGGISNVATPTATNITPPTTYNVVVTAGTGCVSTGNVTLTPDLTNSDEDLIIDCLDNCPLVPGVLGSPCDDLNPQTVNDVLVAGCICQGSECTTDLSLDFQLDGVSTVTWELRQQGSGTVLTTGTVFPGPSALTATTCLPNGCFYLRVLDDGGDGITGGGYILRLSGGKRLVDNRNNFTSGSVSAIANNEGFCLPLGTDRLLYLSCDRLDWTTSEYVIATDNPAVTAIWNTYPSGSTQRANSGYEMWWFNPNGGYSFRRFQSHATANGLNASATRACHFKPNNWTGNQLQNGVLYNVRVRSRVLNVNSEWGGTCRFKLDPVRKQCPLTNLMDLPDNQFYSCNSTRLWGNGNYVHARPVERIVGGVTTSANKYQFRFRIVAENFEVIRTTATGTQNYFVQLNWAASPLQAGKTYQVDVRASFNGGTTWCNTFVAPSWVDPWGPLCNLTITAPMQGGGQNMAMEENANGLQMYPNPNRGDQLYMSLENIEEGVETVSVDIYDTFGKRVSARTIAVQDGFVNTVLKLDGELAAGMYMVNITAGDAIYTERLVIQP